MTKSNFFKCMVMAVAVMLIANVSAEAQLGSLGSKLKNAVNKTEGSSKSGNSTVKSIDPMSVSGKKYYVNANQGSNRNDGSSKTSALKDLQKAIDNADEGSTICVAEGNYLGTLNCGYIEVKKYISIIGGYNSDFSDWNTVKYRTMIQPTPEQNMTSGSRASMTLNVVGKRDGLLMINGIIFDKGQYNRYCTAVTTDPRAGAPEGCETGRILCIGESPSVPATPGAPLEKPLMQGTVEGQVIITNCAFINGFDFAMLIGLKSGHFEVYNNIFVANRMAACDLRGMNVDMNQCTLNFHHNTVMFSWTRDKTLGDMGYGFRYETGICVQDVYNNIFGCNSYAAIERTHFDSNKTIEAARKTSAYDNLFFANAADLLLPSGGGGWLKVPAASFEDVEQLVKYEGNKEISENQKFIDAIDPAYLKGFLGLKITQSSSYNANSAANQVNRAFGLNQQGTETIRVSMYGNRYPLDKAFDLFGAVEGYGAQLPK